MKRRLVLLAAAALFVMHHDFWWWDSTAIVLGFLPVGMAYHAGFSLATALLAYAATRHAWPDDTEADRS